MPYATENASVNTVNHEPRKLVLCFDGTGNVFEGNTSDTNIVKLYDKFDRKDPNQYHYYQTGIGTYDLGAGSVNKGFFGKIGQNVSRTLDSGLATTFDAHVIAGYRFIMRYYKSGDKIYIFGFSRGAFTARFLARMIFRVGLLSEGNEEMVPFAYELYQEYEQGVKSESEPDKKDVNGTERQPTFLGMNSEVDEQQLRKSKLSAFKSTFCRTDVINPDDGLSWENTGVKVYFLGMFDCVSSVAVLDSIFGKAPRTVPVLGTAQHVRHAVAVDEFRVKFKAALLTQDKRGTACKGEDIKEVWFPGNHGDVGGGWPAPDPTKKKRTLWQRIKSIFVTSTDAKAVEHPDCDPYQMSDVPLAWMIREPELIGKAEPDSALKWSMRKDGFKKNFYKNKDQAYESPMHDTTSIGGGSSLFKVMLWRFMEILPIPRWELLKKKKSKEHEWALVKFPPNLRGTRDIPEGALLHASLRKRLNNKTLGYRPTNNHGDGSSACLLTKDFHPHDTDNGDSEYPNSSGVHDIYVLEEPSPP